MNVKKRTRVAKYESNRNSGRISDSQIIDITKEYEKRRHAGENRDTVLRGIAKRFHKRERTIERYIARGRELEIKKRHKQEFKKMNREVLKESYKEHCNGLSSVADIFAHRLKMLSAAKGIKVEGGNIVDGLVCSPNLGESEPSVDGVGIGQGVDDDRAEQLRQHFNQLHPELAVENWRTLQANSPNLKQTEHELTILAQSKAFKRCPDCEVCKALDVV